MRAREVGTADDRGGAGSRGRGDDSARCQAGRDGGRRSGRRGTTRAAPAHEDEDEGDDRRRRRGRAEGGGGARGTSI